MMAITGAIFFVICAIVLFWKRAAFAEMQSMIAGGSVVPGCVVAEAVFVLLMAMALFAAWRAGF